MTNGRYAGYIASLTFVVALTACRRLPELDPAPLPACPGPTVDTSLWRRVEAGEFSLKLPPAARPARVQCIDTSCGRIRVAKWTLEYDSDFLVGATLDSAPAPIDTPDLQQCLIHAGGYDWVVGYFKDGNNGLRGHASVLRWRGGRVSVFMQGRTTSEVAEFIAAIRTIRLRQ